MSRNKYFMAFVRFDQTGRQRWRGTGFNPTEGGNTQLFGLQDWYNAAQDYYPPEAVGEMISRLYGQIECDLH